MPLHVAFLWHMHQPYYVDPIRRAALMPWVRLHATKGYLDMIWLVDQFPEFHCTFNLTPVLLKQIEQLVNEEVSDLWHDMATTPADSLTFAQKCGLLEHFFKANWDNMIKPYPRYWSLLQKRGLNLNRINIDRIAGSFTAQEYRDLQVWFNLTWFGYAGERLYPEIAELKRKGRDFTEDDKTTLFQQQHDVLAGVLKFYKAVADRGQIELSTTPFYHPIMPLVYNTEFARRCMPGRELPPMFSHPEDVRAHLAMARDYHAQVFGAPPHGTWPSEGSVCPELVPILEELGYQWFATDEEVLWRSLAVGHPGKIPDRAQLVQGYRAQFGDASACLAFRERTLSDFIGFTAARNEPRRAAEFMVGHIEQIARSAHQPDPLCAVILDGENAWEHFPDGGEMFLRELYHRLSTRSDIRTTTFHGYFSAHPPAAVLNTLHTGSWIHADFDIWIGDPEENRGWELLGRTRAFLQRKADMKEITPEQYKKAMAEIYAAEGSDWFWWYGGDFVTDNDLIFDELFRTHLQNVYRIVGVPVPDVLKTNICRSEVAHEVRKPTELITPQIDGQVTSFYEWSGAGVYEAGRSLGAMYRSERIVEAIHFGTDLKQFYLRVDLLPRTEMPKRAVLRVNFIQPHHHAIVVPQLHRSGAMKGELLDTNPATGYHALGELTQIASGRIVELAVPFSMLHWEQRDEVAFFIQLLEDDVELERHPEMGTLSFTVPDEQFEIENWRV
jgi:alpha-amylase/alpha-mannosidase (GH57 family)